jgi:membrane protease YdiL (CAAX protease family)
MKRALRFLALTVLVALALSLIAWPVQWISDLTWWRIFRRCASIAALLALYLSLRWDGTSLQELGLTAWSKGRRSALFGIILGGVVLLVMLIVGLLTGVCAIELHPDTGKLVRTLLLFIPGAALVAVLEESVFRGYLLQALHKSSLTFAVLLTSMAYAVVHLKVRELTPLMAQELFGLFLLGMVLALATIWSKNLYLAIGLHAALAYGARVNKLLVAIPDSAYVWWTGTSRLINGVFSWLLLSIVAGIIYLWVKRQQSSGGAV